MSRKAVYLFAVLTLTLGALLSASTGVAQEQTELVFVYWNWGPEATPGWETTFEDFLAENPDITIRLMPVEGANWGSYLDGVAILIAGGEKPDTLWVATEGVQLLVSELELAMPLDDRIEADAEELQEYFDDVPAALLDANRVDGKLYGMPYSWNNMVIYYNTARFEEAGLEPPSPDWTRDEFLEIAQALTVDDDGDGTPERYGFAWDNSGVFGSAMPWIFANGTDIITEDFCAPQVTDPGVIEALQFMYDMIYTYKVAPSPTVYGDLYNLFQNGDVAMFGAGRWPLASFVPAEFTDFDIQYWPGNPDRKTEFGLDAFPILSTSQNPDAAWKLIKFLTRADVQDRLIGTVDAPVSNVPARRSVGEAMQDMPPPNSAAFFDSLDGDAAPVPAPPRFNQMENIFLRYTGLIFADEMSVEEAMEAAQDELAEVVTCD